MKHAELNDNNEVVTLRSAPYPEDAPWTIEVPDYVELGWVRGEEGDWAPGPKARRATLVEELAALWATCPSYIQGPLIPQYDRAIALLAADDPARAEQARDIFLYLEPPAAFDASQRATLEGRRPALAAKVQEIIDLFFITT